MANVNNYIKAGNAAVRKAVQIRKALSENKADYGALGEASIVAAKEQKVAAIKANAMVANASLDAAGKMEQTDILVERDKSIANSRRTARKAGMLAAGAQALGVAHYLNKKKDETNPMLAKYQSLIDKNNGRLADADQKIADAQSILDGFKDTTTKPTATPSTSNTSNSPSGSPQASSSASPAFKDIVDMATSSGAKYPQLVAAQWALESGYGKTPSGKNNFFGIKATSGEQSTSKPTWEVINGQEVNTTADFKDFDSPQGSVDELVNKWYKNFDGYQGVNNAPSASDAAGMLVTENYATDPAYADKLRKIMSDNGY